MSLVSYCALHTLTACSVDTTHIMPQNPDNTEELANIYQLDAGHNRYTLLVAWSETTTD